MNTKNIDCSAAETALGRISVHLGRALHPGERGVFNLQGEAEISLDIIERYFANEYEEQPHWPRPSTNLQDTPVHVHAVHALEKAGIHTVGDVYRARYVRVAGLVRPCHMPRIEAVLSLADFSLTVWKKGAVL